MSTTSDPESQHHWTGWPGAMCLKCHMNDPMEHAIANNLFDPFTGVWVSEADEAAYRSAAVCPVKGTLQWDTTLSKWKFIPAGA